MTKDNMPIDYWEHYFDKKIYEYTEERYRPLSKLFLSKRKDDRYCYHIIYGTEAGKYSIKADYFIGVDWIIQNKTSIVVSPKLDKKIAERYKELVAEKEISESDEQPNKKEQFVSIDYFNMLNQCLSEEYLYVEIDNIINIDWVAPEIPIQQSQDFLTPLLVVRFLNMLKVIVKKGLKKSYYKVTQNLNSRVKGKILVGENICQNVLKNRLTSTLCQYEEFGTDTLENRLLKKGFAFAVSYIENHSKLFESDVKGKKGNPIKELITYCRPAFEKVSNNIEAHDLVHHKANPFFKEYKEGIKLAKLILKRYAYTLSKTSTEQVTTPPYWIDMPMLFELYAFHFLKQKFPVKDEVKYHFSTYGNQLDFLINKDNCKMVVDAKYKPKYTMKAIHEDIRQVAGYARLNKVYKELGLDGETHLIDCLIIYPDIDGGCSLEKFRDRELKELYTEIGGYKHVYKVGIVLPVKSE